MTDTQNKEKQPNVVESSRPRFVRKAGDDGDQERRFQHVEKKAPTSYRGAKEKRRMMQIGDATYRVSISRHACIQNQVY